MYKILKLNKIHEKAEAKLSKGYILSDSEENPDGIIVRSAKMHDYNPASNLMAVARAGAGVNNIPIEKYRDLGIVVFNTPGANANAVKELVVCGILLASREIIKSIEWAKTLKGKGKDVPQLVEKGKEAFAGYEIMGKTIGIIGLGAIGSLVAQAAIGLKMSVIGYDPYIAVDTAWTLSSDMTTTKNLDHLYCNSDYISIHSPLTDTTREMLNAEAFSKMKNGVCIINCARNELVNNNDIIEALKSGKVAKYVTDFPSDELIGVENIIAIPHLGASTAEAETNCAIMAADELKEYLENGNIVNSVNYPNLSLPRSGDTRITLNLKVPSVASAEAPELIKSYGHTITGMIASTKCDATYKIIDFMGKPSAELISKINVLPGVLKVRTIR